MTIKLSLDHTAIERILAEDDGTIKMELRQAIIENFARRHLKTVINDSTFQLVQQNLLSAAKRVVEEEVGYFKKEGFRDKGQAVINHDVKNMVRDYIKTEVSDLVKAQVDEAIEKIKDGKIERMIKQAINYDIDRQVGQRVKEKLIEAQNTLSSLAK